MQILRSLNAMILATALLPFGAQAVNDYVLTISVQDSSDPGSPRPDLCSQGGAGCSLRSAILLANDQNRDGNRGKVLITLETDVMLTQANPKEDRGLDGDLDITGDIEINGNGYSVNAQGTDRVFHIHHSSKTVINDLEITGGSLMGINNNLGRLDTSINNAGGGIFIAEGGDLTLNNVILTVNSAPIGGAIASMGRLTIKGTGSDAFNRSRIHTNFALNPSELSEGVNFQVDTINPGQGGAIANFGGYLAIGSTRITNNAAGIGGAIYNTSAGLSFGQAILTDIIIDKNRSISHGAGIANQGPMNINQSAIIGNKVVLSIPEYEINIGSELYGDGGGIFNGGIANADISNTTISGNIARSGGGAYSSRNISFSNVTIYDNTAIPCQSCADTQSTIGGHQVAVYDSDLEIGSSGDPQVNFTNTVVASNPNDSRQSDAISKSCAGSTDFTLFITSQSNNFDDDGSCEFTSGTDIGGLTTVAGEIVSSNPLLAPLSATPEEYDQNISSGLTPAHKPDYFGEGDINNSPLVDKGNNNACSRWDQHFFEYKDTDTCDIGALETNPGRKIKGEAQYVDLKVDIVDSRDPVPPGSNQSDGQLQYTIGVTNLYQGPASLGTELRVYLPQDSSIIFAQTNRGDSIATDTINNIVVVSFERIDGLERVTTTITITPPKYETIIQAEAEVFPGPNEEDAFEANNKDVETTEVTSRASIGGDNWGGGGGGGPVNLFTLFALLGLLSLVRQTKQN